MVGGIKLCSMASRLAISSTPSGGTEEVTGHGLGGADRYRSCPLTKHPLDSHCFEIIIVLGGGAVCVDIIHIISCQAGVL